MANKADIASDKSNITANRHYIEQNTTNITNLNNRINHDSMGAIRQANNYTNQKFYQLNGKINDVQTIAEAGTASAMAISQIPLNPNTPYTAGFAVAGYGSQSALAVGFKAHKDNIAFNLGSSYDTAHQFGVAAGVGVGF